MSEHLTDQQMDLLIEEVKLENEQLIRDYLDYVLRPRDKQREPEENAQLYNPVG